MSEILKKEPTAYIGWGISQYLVKKELKSFVNLVSHLWTCQLKEFLLLWEFIKLFQGIQGFPELFTNYRGGMNLSKSILPSLLLGNRDSEFCYNMFSFTELWYFPPHPSVLSECWVLPLCNSFLWSYPRHLPRIFIIICREFVVFRTL